MNHQTVPAKLLGLGLQVIDQFSGSTWVSFLMRKTTEFILSFSASSTIAISTAIMPVASPFARLEFPSARSSNASRSCMNRLAPAYSSLIEAVDDSVSPPGRFSSYSTDRFRPKKGYLSSLTELVVISDQVRSEKRPIRNKSEKIL
ncbi:hypothetical protein [Spirosoma endbachense]|uniref:hypothetical protein n=1 Tax=Spirosoma endbachense TaxID=2666025 RepID=UPI00293BF737|nr:hypothetical protein [Spirosoma endbachense]